MISTIKSGSALQEIRRFRARHVLLSIAVAALAYSTATLAQNEDKVKTGLTAWRNSGCADCHGPFADGDQTTTTTRGGQTCGSPSSMPPR
jgi:hypothetical protein